MKYYIIRKADGHKHEISREEAKSHLKANYSERVCTFDEMLNTENIYPCMFNVIEVKGE